MPNFHLTTDPVEMGTFLAFVGQTLKSIAEAPPTPEMRVPPLELEASQLFQYVMGSITVSLGVTGQPWDGTLVDNEQVARALFTNALNIAKWQT
jgi:hypothetical protein